MRLMVIGLWVVLCFVGVLVMANSKSLVYVNEKDHLPPLDPQTDAWYREAAALTKSDTLRPWGRIVELYSKAVERGRWEATHNLASLYRTGWPGGAEKDTQKALDPYQKMIDLDVPQGFYDMGAMVGSCAGAKNPATDGPTFLDKTVSLGNPSALTRLGKFYTYVAKKGDLGLVHIYCVASQGYVPASYELEVYYRIVEHNFPKALVYYQVSISQEGKSAVFFLSRVFGSETPPVSAMWYTPDKKLREAYYSIYKKLEADPDSCFPNLIEDYPLPPHPIQGCDANHPDWKPKR